MKAFKLIVIFIVLLGGVVGAFFLLTDVEIDVLPSPSNTIYQSYSDEIKDDWKKKGDWDEKLFLRHCESISQLGTKSETGTLKDLNTTTAIEIVIRKIFDAFLPKEHDREIHPGNPGDRARGQECRNRRKGQEDPQRLCHLLRSLSPGAPKHRPVSFVQWT